MQRLYNKQCNGPTIKIWWQYNVPPTTKDKCSIAIKKDNPPVKKQINKHMITLETPRLLLRKLTIKEYDDLFENYTQQDAMTFLGMTSEEEFLEHKKKYEGGMSTYRTSFVFFQLIEKDSARIIGDCCFHTWYVPHFRAEIGYGLKEDKDKNKGYMKEALFPVVAYGFEDMGLNRIEAFISPNNIPSQKLVTGLGFKEEGRLREHYCKNGVIEDSLIFGLLRKEFNHNNR